MNDLQSLLELASRDHDHLCPRQVLGVRLGLAGILSLGIDVHLHKKRLLVIVETDGCFADGITAATGCTIGHRTLRVEDYGKTAAVFVDTTTGRSLRLAPLTDLRTRASEFIPEEPNKYQAQLQAYQIMPNELMFSVRPVLLKTSIAAILSKPGLRVTCFRCGEEIMNEREVKGKDSLLCQSCASGGYYQE